MSPMSFKVHGPKSNFDTGILSNSVTLKGANINFFHDRSPIWALHGSITKGLGLKLCKGEE
jgi:hypothetical protein